MGVLKGPILFTGSIGDIRVYYDKTLKKYIVSTKGGSPKEIIENNPNMARQRENMSEFKACTKWTSQLRKALDSIGHLNYGHYFSYQVAVAKLIQKQDNLGLKGHRSVESSKYPRLLKSLNFNALHPFDQALAHQYDVLFSSDKRTVTLKLMGFRSFSRINWSSRYEVYRITMVIAQQPDWIWDEQNGLFKPSVDNLEMLSVTTFSDWHQRSTDSVDIILTASFAQPALQQTGTTVVVAMGIEVSAYQLDSSTANATGVGTMKIVECFV
jgi:hypothetical protein